MLLGYGRAAARAASRRGTATRLPVLRGGAGRVARTRTPTPTRPRLACLPAARNAEKQAEREGGDGREDGRGGATIHGGSLQCGPPFCALPVHVAPFVGLPTNVPPLLKNVAMPRLIVVPENKAGTTVLVTVLVALVAMVAP